MEKRELSVVELQQLFEGNGFIKVEGSFLHIHLSQGYIGIPIKGLYIEVDNDLQIELISRKVWLTYLKYSKKIHLTIL